MPTVIRTGAIFNGAVNATEYRLPGDVDDTAAFNRAAATGMAIYVPRGIYAVSDAITLRNGQMMYGDGRTESVLAVKPDFNMSALGVVKLGASEPGATIRDIGISFMQPSSSSRESMTQYPSAIYAHGVPRFKIRDVRISGAWTGIDARGNVGGAMISQVEIGAISAGLRFNGARDFVHLTDIHIWPFGFTDAARLAAWGDGGTVAAEFVSVVSLNIKGWNTYQARTLVQNRTIGVMSAVALDGNYSRIEQTDVASTINISGLYKTSALAGDFVAYVQEGSLKISSFDVAMVNGNRPLFEVDGSSTLGTSIIASSGIVRSGPRDAPVFQITRGSMNLSGINFTYGVNEARTAGYVKEVNGRLSMVGCTFRDIGSGSGPGLEIGTDGWHAIVGNVGLGWPARYPNNTAFGTYAANAPASWNR